MTRITLEEPRAAGYPVVKRTALGQTFKGAVLKAESRDRLKRDEVTNDMRPMVKSNGKHAQELVVTVLTLPGTTAPAGLGDEESVPEPGAIVRLILKGKAFGDWIESKRALPSGAVAVGDVVTQTTTVAQVYDASGNPSGGEISDQSKVEEARQRGRSVGIYGPLTLEVSDEASEWTEKAVKAYRSLQEPIPAETSGDFYSAGPVATPEPQRPAAISEDSWKKMDTATKKQVAETMSSVPSDQPPF